LLAMTGELAPFGECSFAAFHSPALSQRKNLTRS
jgi:hypothetical protein